MNPERPSRAKTGSVGETIAVLELERRDWKILTRNFRCKQGEIDIIAEQKTKGEKTLVFVEVKTRNGTAHGNPIESVTARKRARIITVAQVYLSEFYADLPEPNCRFDIVEVLFKPDGFASVKVVSGAFGASDL